MGNKALRFAAGPLLICALALPIQAELVTVIVKDAGELGQAPQLKLDESVASIRGGERDRVSFELALPGGGVILAGAYPDQDAEKLRAALLDPLKRVTAALQYRNADDMELLRISLQIPREDLGPAGVYEYSGAGGPFYGRRLRQARREFPTQERRARASSSRRLSAFPPQSMTPVPREAGYLLSLKIRLGSSGALESLKRIRRDPIADRHADMAHPRGEAHEMRRGPQQRQHFSGSACGTRRNPSESRPSFSRSCILISQASNVKYEGRERL